MIENINLKAVLLAITLLLFTYSYYVREPGSIMSIGTVVALGAIAVGIFFAYFFIIKLIAFTMQSKMYPHVAFHILLPLIFMVLLVWFIFALLYLKPFGIPAHFYNMLQAFFAKHVLFIAICSIAIGLTLSFSLPKNNLGHPLLLRNNIICLLGMFGLFIGSIIIFYGAKKIKQDPTNIKEEDYKNLADFSSSGDHQLSRLLAADEYNYVQKPYLIPYHDELIIIATYGSNNRNPPIQAIYKLNKDGDIIAKINEQELTDDHFFPLLAKDGILTDFNGKELITWIFDGNTERKANANFSPKQNLVLDTLQENPSPLKTTYFQKTNTFHCNNNRALQYNGTRYYDLTTPDKQFKIKIDSVYSHSDNIENCKEKKLEYYTSDKLNFSLLRLNEHEYYIIKPKKK